jgi:hypothetical protein
LGKTSVVGFGNPLHMEIHFKFSSQRL